MVKMKNELKKWLSVQKYDKNYQDIDCIDFIGYSQSHLTWERMKDIVVWDNKKVADVGCFHCYFSIKVSKLGADVTSMDINEGVLKTSQMINEIEGNKLTLVQWEGGEEVSSDFDICLCLNVLHHFKDVKKSLQNMKAKQVIFETNIDLLDEIKVYFDIEKRVASHRSNRIILLCNRK